MWRDALLVAGKDLRIEARSRVTTNQVAPYAVLVLLLFGFAFDQDHQLLVRAAPGLFWVSVLFCALLAIARSFAVEAADGASDWELRMSLRYAHAEGYIRMLAGQHGFAVRRLSRHPLRIDQGQPVTGLFAWLDRPGHTV